MCSCCRLLLSLLVWLLAATAAEASTQSVDQVERIIYEGDREVARNTVSLPDPLDLVWIANEVRIVFITASATSRKRQGAHQSPGHRVQGPDHCIQFHDSHVRFHLR